MQKRVLDWTQAAICAAVVVSAVIQEVRDPQAFMTCFVAAVIMLAATVFVKKQALLAEVTAMGFLFCLISAGGLLVALPAIAVQGRVFRARPAVLLIAFACVLALARPAYRDASGRPSPWRRLLSAVAIALASVFIAAFAFLSQTYTLEWPVLRNALLNLLLLPAGLVAFHALEKPDSPVSARTALVLAGLAGMAVGSALGVR